MTAGRGFVPGCRRLSPSRMALAMPSWAAEAARTMADLETRFNAPATAGEAASDGDATGAARPGTP